ncbi:MAG: PTS sugar transporter subunit IIB [Fusobacteriaceae bacterium]
MKKILLLCSAGMSTSIVVKKMKEAALEQNIETKIEAVGLEQFHDLVDEYDVFLLGPQVRYKKPELEKIANEKNKPLEIINTMDYGMMNGKKILEFAMSLEYNK